jgi:hypothetical protein
VKVVSVYKRQINGFMRDSLKLELSDSKTLITHGRTQAARFLGYEVVVFHDDSRAINSIIGLKVPANAVCAKCALPRGWQTHTPGKTSKL